MHQKLLAALIIGNWCEEAAPSPVMIRNRVRAAEKALFGYNIQSRPSNVTAEEIKSVGKVTFDRMVERGLAAEVGGKVASVRSVAVAKHPNSEEDAFKFELSSEAQRLTSIAKNNEAYAILTQSGDANLEEVDMLEDLQIIASRLKKWHIRLELDPSALGLVSRIKSGPK